MIDGQVVLDAEPLNDHRARFYHTIVGEGKVVYFFVVRDKHGTYRAAANGCQVCYEFRSGFRQQGEMMVCNACRNGYPIEETGTEEGGCNPAPISPSLGVEHGRLTLTEADLLKIVSLF